MGEELQISYMQARMVRKACTNWNLPLEKVNSIFSKHQIYGYIHLFWDIFHTEGDDEVFFEIERYLDNKGVKV